MSKPENDPPARQRKARDKIEKVEHELPDKKLLAIDRMVTGEQLQDVADGLGIDRATLWRWRTHDPAFIAALNRRRAELHQGLVDNFWGGLVPNALKVAAESLAEGDPEMARDILRLAARGLTDLKIPDTDASDGGT